jgi:hypothetical protein
MCVLTAVGALAGAAAVWLSAYWGIGWALLAVSVLFLLVAMLAMVAAKVWMKFVSERKDPITEAAEGLWKAHPTAIAAVATLLVFVVASRPRLIGRLLGAAAKSTGLLLMLRRLL